MADTYDEKVYYGDADGDPRISEAIEFLRQAAEADTTNRAEALDDVKFAAGDQWPVEIQNSRNLEARPCLTINKVDAYVRQICNQQRQQRPRIKCQGMNNETDAKMAEIITGICRHVETNSNADHAYDTAFDFAVRMGWGYWRVTTDYVRPDSFDQEIYIKPIDNPFTVYFDPNSTAPDGSDAEKCLITVVMAKENFRKMYPGHDDGGSFSARGTGDSNSEWVTKHDIRIAEYFYTRIISTHLVLLSDGTSAYEDELPSAEIMENAGVYEVSRRKTFKKQIKWCKVTAMEVLEEGTWAGKYIPVVPTYGQQCVVDNKRKKFGLVRMAKDPQRMYNFWQTSMTESVALAPRAKWIMAEGQDEGHETEWAGANNTSYAYLRYKQTDINGQPAPPPIRQVPEQPPAAIMAASQSITQDLQAVVGIFDPSQLPQGNVSGKALNGQQMQVDMTNFHYYDNLTRSIAHTGRIILDLIPKIYSTERVMRIIGDDGKPELTTINQKTVGQDGVEMVLNDVTVGEYDVVMETGPGYNTKRQEAVDSMMTLLAADPALMQQAGDLIFRNMDFPGAEIIADRLASVNPLAQIDDKSPIPPQVQMQLANSQQQMQQMAQQIQALQMMIKNRQDVEQVRQVGEDRRAVLAAEVKLHDQNTRSVTSQNKTEIDALMKLILGHMDTARLEAEIASRNQDQSVYMNRAANSIEDNMAQMIPPPPQQQMPQGQPQQQPEQPMM
ncbi:Phage P22-like portal protein [uncultured Caudovirales phage]|uniref:Phage P22-like portal protein n=1 Tax=uncultured Caudovirales phage TaxID=2100421 RepID=A0A6J5KN96_9CAUD|nr:Phage P22-like portal protein [uncultured Caudovirales phage]